MIHERPSFPSDGADHGDPFASIHVNPFAEGRTEDRAEERERRWDSVNNRHHVLAAVCVLLAAAIGAAIWYIYPVVAAHKADLVRLPGLAASVDTIANHLRQSDAQVADWARQQEVDRQALEAQMARVTRDVHNSMANARKEISNAANGAYASLQTRVSEQFDRIETRLAGVENTHNEDQKQIAALQEELARVRQDAQQQSEKIAGLEHQVDQSGAAVGSQIAGLQLAQDRDRRDVDAIGAQLAFEKISFEAAKGQDRELASGLWLHIVRTDAARGRFDAWVAPKRGQRSIEVRHQGIQEPLIFYGPEDGKKRELVVTSVDRNSVAGYVLLPKPAANRAASGL